MTAGRLSPVTWGDLKSAVRPLPLEKGNHYEHDAKRSSKASLRFREWSMPRRRRAISPAERASNSGF
jgi:hypothetical protein